MIKFTDQTLSTIYKQLLSELNNISFDDILEFQVINPDFYNGLYSGTKVEIEKQIYIHRNLNSWNDLAQKLFCKMLVPKYIDETHVLIRFKKLNNKTSFHNMKDDTEKYGVESEFFNINKNEEPEVLLTYLKALNSVALNKKKRVLNLGVNGGNEFEIIKNEFSEFKDLELVGIDYCPSAINRAKECFENDENVSFYCHDINDLKSLDLGSFDLIISIGTLQSSNLDFNKTFMDIVQNYLNKEGAMILGFPNCRWIDGEIVYGAKASNYSYSEMSVLFKDAVFCKKYLQQKKFRVTLTGKYYIFLTATSIRK